MQSDSIACSLRSRWRKFTIALVLDRVARVHRGRVACLRPMDLARGALVIPALNNVRLGAPFDSHHERAAAGLPRVSILFSALDEAEKLPAALASFLAQDYPDYEVIAVDDRSEDATGSILDTAARDTRRLKVVHVTSLPAGWLGKPHGLQQAFEHSNGEWLVFTDADVRFEPEVLRSTIALAEERHWDHLTLLCHAEMFTPGEKIAMTFFAMSLMLSLRPWRASDSRSSAYVGIGAFQLIRRSAYEKMGTHRRLAMEVVDDVKLGKLVKAAGLRSGVATAGRAVSVHWHSGLGNIIRGTTKNFYATTGFRLWVACRTNRGNFADVPAAVASFAVCARMGARFRGSGDSAADPGAGRRGAGIRRVAFVRGDAAAGGFNFCVDDSAVNFCDFAAGRDLLARDFLSD